MYQKSDLAELVKQLEWLDGQHDRKFSKCAVGQYSIRDFGQGIFWLDLNGSLISSHKTLSEGQYSAQDHYVAKILSALNILEAQS